MGPADDDNDNARDSDCEIVEVRAGERKSPPGLELKDSNEFTQEEWRKTVRRRLAPFVLSSSPRFLSFFLI